VIDLGLDPLDVSRGQVYLVDHGDDHKIVLHRGVEVRQGLRLHALRGIDQEKHAFTGGERPRHLVREVDMPGGVDEVQLELVSVLTRVGQADRLALDRDPPLPLYVHVVEDLVPELPVVHEVRILDEPVGKRGLAVIDMGNDAEVSDLFHLAAFSGNPR